MVKYVYEYNFNGEDFRMDFDESEQNIKYWEDLYKNGAFPDMPEGYRIQRKIMENLADNQNIHIYPSARNRNEDEIIKQINHGKDCARSIMNPPNNINLIKYKRMGLDEWDFFSLDDFVNNH